MLPVHHKNCIFLRIAWHAFVDEHDISPLDHQLNKHLRVIRLISSQSESHSPIWNRVLQLITRYRVHDYIYWYEMEIIEGYLRRLQLPRAEKIAAGRPRNSHQDPTLWRPASKCWHFDQPPDCVMRASKLRFAEGDAVGAPVPSLYVLSVFPPFPCTFSRFAIVILLRPS